MTQPIPPFILLPPNTNVGPGMYVQWVGTIFVPPGEGCVTTISIMVGPDFESPVLQHFFQQSGSNSGLLELGRAIDGLVGVGTAFSTVAEGAAVRVRVRLEVPTTSQIETFDVPATWSLGTLYWNLLRNISGGTGGGGLLADERTMLMTTIPGWVSRSLRAAAGGLVGGGINQLLNRYDAAFTEISAACIEMTGTGSHAPADVLPLADKIGMLLTATGIPPRLSVILGTVPTYEPRLAQVACTHLFGGDAFTHVTDVRDLRVQQLVWFFPTPNPATVNWTVMPEVTVTGCYLTGRLPQ